MSKYEIHIHQWAFADINGARLNGSLVCSECGHWATSEQAWWLYENMPYERFNAIPWMADIPVTVET